VQCMDAGENRRLVVVPIPDCFIGDMCKTTGEDCVFVNIEGIPKDAQLINIYYDNINRQVMVIFEHESFDPISQGWPIPSKLIRHTKYYV